MKTKYGVLYCIVWSVAIMNITSEIEAQPKTFKNSIGMEFVLIQPGTFWMGCNCKDDPSTEKNECDEDRCNSDEYPYHQVTFMQAFYIARTEVTQEQWYAVMENNPSVFGTKKVGMDSRYHPVENISWDDAQVFIRKLNTLEGTKAYRLPTEAEWEYTARAGSDTNYCFGNDAGEILDEYAWNARNSQEKTHPVGQKNPNAWGLYDMHGNVWEWVADTYYNNYNDTPTDGSAWGSLDDGMVKLLRGGSWGTFPLFCRSSNRDWKSPTDGNEHIGLRLVFSTTF